MYKIWPIYKVPAFIWPSFGLFGLNLFEQCKPSNILPYLMFVSDWMMIVKKPIFRVAKARAQHFVKLFYQYSVLQSGKVYYTKLPVICDQMTPST